ncbi:hypothetical protein PSJE_17190 [Pseudomonas jessenii]|nr:hypothetical protein PSJE_17190 [Pseudomonas jessenii]
MRCIRQLSSRRWWSRRAASSFTTRLFESSTDFSGWNAKHCGSELARDCVRSVDINVECDAAIASKLAPTGIAFILISVI